MQKNIMPSKESNSENNKSEVVADVLSAKEAINNALKKSEDTLSEASFENFDETSKINETMDENLPDRHEVSKKRNSFSDKIKPSCSFVFLCVVIFLMEVFLRIKMDINGKIGGLFNMGLLYTALFSVFFASVINALCNIGKKAKTRKITACVLLALLAVMFLTEYFLKHVYGNYMSIAVILMSAQNVVGSYSDIIVSTLIHGIPVIILYLLPAVIVLLWGEKIFSSGKNKVAGLACGLLCMVAALVMIFCISSGMVTDKEYFTTHFDINKSTTRFGLVGSFCLDSTYAIIGTPNVGGESFIPAFISFNDIMDRSNVTDIDFQGLKEEYPDGTVNVVTDYVSSQMPSEKNEYTGYFKGKNLIFICAEAFTPYIIDETDTPTLYKLANNGFVFTNYYQPSWMVSTSDGEYTLFNSLIPKYGSQSMYAGSENNWYYSLANSLKREGYATYAYHNHNYEYYNRQLTHPNLGYDVYMGMGNGMEEYVTNQWPESDLEMMESTVDLFVDSLIPFHVYYLTVSGHTEYNFYGNNMAYKNEDNISDTSSSEPVRAIKACNMELEYALSSLMSQLEEAGVLDDTVIVLSADHYPYGLSDEAYNELAGKDLDPDFERYHNKLIIYNSAMQENVIVDDYCCGIDVLPTLLNLFGVEYDSRLLMGSDILSDAQKLVIFQDYSWITDKGRYEADSGVFYPANEDEKIDEEYIQNISKIVSNKVLISKYILENDYYDIVFSDK